MSTQIINSSATTSTDFHKGLTVISTSYNVAAEESTNYKKKSKVSKIPALRLQIKAQIKNIESEVMLQAVGEMLKNLSTEQLISQITKPKRVTLTVEDLIEEQKYKGFDRVGFDKLVVELAVEDSVEELLALSNA